MTENSTPHTRAPRASVADPRSPFVFDVRLLGRQAGSTEVHSRRIPAPALLGGDLIGVAEGAPLDLDVRLEAVSEGVLVTGTVHATATGECGRCLDHIAEDLVVNICELFAYPASTTDETTGADEVLRIGGERLDVEPVVRDAVVLGLPWTPLCRPDCAGLCPTCGQRLDELPDEHAHESIDPRWAGLASFTPQSGTDEPTTKE